MQRHCLLIPHYRHERELIDWLPALAKAGLPAVIVDDGSGESSVGQLEKAIQGYGHVSLLRRAQNGGKGRASIDGMRWAQDHGYTHVVSMDADGQHCLPDLPKFLAASKRDPQALVSGAPRFGADIPPSRLHGRKITNTLVQIEAGNFRLTDAMCGYRLYPLASCLPLCDELGPRLHMQFDVELLVRAAWAEIPVVFIGTPVTYPSDGRSHFRLVQDNALLTLMHIRLLATALWRLPRRALSRSEPAI